MCEVDFDGTTLTARGTNKASHFALVGHGHEGDLVLDRADIAGVDLKKAGLLTNGNLRVTTRAGVTHQLHFLRKHADDFADLAKRLQPGL